MRVPRRLGLIAAVAVALPAGGALALGLGPEQDLQTVTTNNVTEVSAAPTPAISPLAGVAGLGVGDDAHIPIGGVARVGGALVSGPPQQDAGDTLPAQVFAAPDGTLTAVWSARSAPNIKAARLAPGATTWTPITVISGVKIGPHAAAMASDGTIKVVDVDDSIAGAVKVELRTLAPGATSWQPPVTVRTLASTTHMSSSREAYPQLAISPAGYVATDWIDSDASSVDHVEALLQKADGTWGSGSRGTSGTSLALRNIAMPDSGRAATFVFASVVSSYAINFIHLQDNGSGGIDDAAYNRVPTASGDALGNFDGADVYLADGTQRVVVARSGHLSESDIALNGQNPSALSTVADDANADPDRWHGQDLVRLSDGSTLLAWASDDNTTATIKAASRASGAAAWGAVQTVQGAIATGSGDLSLGGASADGQGDAYVAWATVQSHVVKASGRVFDGSPPALPTTFGMLGAHFSGSATPSDSWSAVGAVHWDFGDGTSADGNTVDHTYAGAGVRTVTATDADAAGNTATQTIVVTAPAVQAPPSTGTLPLATPVRDTTRPKLALTSPACAKKLSKAACATYKASAKAWRTLKGTASDAGGLASVTLVATSGSGKHCKVLSTGGKRKTAACAKAAKLKATIKGGAWTIKAPGLAKGTWHLVLVATDKAGNATTAKKTLALKR